MLLLISGGNGSGKSHVAELIASQIARPRYYAATMIPYGEEGAARKAKHIRNRAGLNFSTVECPFDLSQVHCNPGDLVLLEDLSNLLANGLFAAKPRFGADEVLSQVHALKARCAYLLIVTISGLSGEGCDDETCAYVNELNRLNEIFTSEADVTIEMHNGKACVTKGEPQWELG